MENNATPFVAPADPVNLPSAVADYRAACAAAVAAPNWRTLDRVVAARRHLGLFLDREAVAALDAQLAAEAEALAEAAPERFICAVCGREHAEGDADAVACGRYYDLSYGGAFLA